MGKGDAAQDQRGEARGPFLLRNCDAAGYKESKWEWSKVILWEMRRVLKSPSWTLSNWRILEGAAKCVFGMKGWEEVCVEGRGRSGEVSGEEPPPRPEPRPGFHLPKR